MGLFVVAVVLGRNDVMEFIETVQKDGVQQKARPVVHSVVLIVSNGNG